MTSLSSRNTARATALCERLGRWGTTTYLGKEVERVCARGFMNAAREPFEAGLGTEPFEGLKPLRMMQNRQGSIIGSQGAVAFRRSVDGESLARSWRYASTPEEFSPNRPVNFPIGEELGSQNDVSAMVDLIDHNVFDTQCMHAS